MRSRKARLAVVVDRYPCLSESFVRRDLARLAAEDFEVALVACTGAGRGDAWLDGEAMTIFRPRWRGAFGPTVLRRLPDARPLLPPGPRGLARAARVAWTALAIQPQLTRWRPDWIHAHFLGIPAATAALLAEALAVPLSISAHARDIFVPTVDVAAVCARARFVSACSEHAQASLLGRLSPDHADRVICFPHDVDCDLAVAASDAAPGAPLQLLSICRLVPKKGIDVVLRALALLPHIRVQYRIVGSGPELPRLRALVRQLGLWNVEFAGALSPAEAMRELERADLFALGTRTAADGDRDGIPNAILEAMAAGVPVVASDGGAVSEVIRHRRTGWLTPPNDASAMAAALLEAASDAPLRRRIAVRARTALRARFARDRTAAGLPMRLRHELRANHPIQGAVSTHLNRP